MALVDQNPYASPESEALADNRGFIETKEYGGIGRLAFFLIWIGIWVAQNLLGYSMARLGPEYQLYLMVLALPLLLVYVGPLYFRLKNIGMNPWWCLAMVVPLLNILIWIRCLLVPEGYADTRKLDTAGKVISGIVLVAFVLAVVAIIVSAGFWS